MTKMNPWNPITSPIDLKHLGKLSEELNECGAAVARCIIQGINEAEPSTGKINRDWLEDEIADVQANIELVRLHFNLNDQKIFDRTLRKINQLRQWHQMLQLDPITKD